MQLPRPVRKKAEGGDGARGAVIGLVQGKVAGDKEQSAGEDEVAGAALVDDDADGDAEREVFRGSLSRLPFEAPFRLTLVPQASETTVVATLASLARLRWRRHHRCRLMLAPTR